MAQILTSTDPVSEIFDGTGNVLQIWVSAPHGSTWPAGVTVKLQQQRDFGESGGPHWDDTELTAWSAAGWKNPVLPAGQKYRLKPSAVGVVARIDPISETVKVST